VSQDISKTKKEMELCLIVLICLIVILRASEARIGGFIEDED